MHEKSYYFQLKILKMTLAALRFITTTLDQYLKNQFDLEDNHVVLNQLVERDGTEPLINQNKIVLTLLNRRNEVMLGNSGFTIDAQAKDFRDNGAIISLSLDILASSNFSDYAEALSFLDATALFFQQNSRFSAKNYPNILKGIERINVESENLDFLQIENVWASIGTKLKPSNIYKLRVIGIQNES